MQTRPVPTVEVRRFDIDTARRYLASIQALTTEALESRDPRVLFGTLEILADQRASVRELFGGGD